MRRILLKEACAGMSLAADAVNAQQMLLLKKGTALTEKSLQMLKSWGVETVCIAQSETEDIETVSPADNSAAIQEELLSQFADTVENPIMAEICRVAAEIVHERTHSA
jgi:biotin carboxylase